MDTQGNECRIQKTNEGSILHSQRLLENEKPYGVTEPRKASLDPGGDFGQPTWKRGTRSNALETLRNGVEHVPTKADVDSFRLTRSFR